MVSSTRERERERERESGGRAGRARQAGGCEGETNQRLLEKWANFG